MGNQCAQVQVVKIAREIALLQAHQRIVALLGREALLVEGYIQIDEDGVYYFSTDNEEFWLDGVKLIDNSGEVKRFSRNDKSVALAKGLHPIKIVYLGHIIGGWPSVWNDGKVEMRKSNQEKFEKIDGRIFFN